MTWFSNNLQSASQFSTQLTPRILYPTASSLTVGEHCGRELEFYVPV